MHILAQLIRPAIRGVGPEIVCQSAILFLLALLSACNDGPPPPPGLPPATALQQPAPPAPPDEPAPEAHPDSFGIPGHPMEAWTYADDFQELHAIWSARFALSAAPATSPDTLLPYADAVLLDGNSWGIQPDSIQLVFMDKQNRAWRVRGPAHPATDDARPRELLSPEALKAMGWSTLQSTRILQQTWRGSAIEVVGPLHWAESCAPCHGTPPDTLAGVLMYEFNEIPDD